MRTTPALLLALLLLPLGGCFLSRETVNEPIRRAEIERLVPGTTTAREAAERLGAPNEVVQLGTRSAWRYDFTTSKRAGFTVIVVSFLNEDTRADRVWLFFDAHDVLTHAGSTLEAAGSEYAMPWERIHAR